ncbi:MAG TPA: M81 family metallopeptidase [Roseiflexaceae bacterium]|nr:M81 family metallopeptidase [Roseiflexaceae bacterium]
MSQRLRIITGGIHHETNSFTPLPTSYDDFEIDRGLERYADDAGALAPLDTIELVPTFVAGAFPGGLVQRGAYERLKAGLLAELAAALPADGLLLDLHGAMEVDGIGDGESDLIEAVRKLVGDDLPIAVSLDLHGNISPTLVARANILTAYRTAPHRDQRATRRRALELLAQALLSGQRPVTAMVKLPLILAGEAAVTDVEPARSLYAQLAALAQTPGLLDASLLIGCAWTDSPYTAVSPIVVAASDAALAQQHATKLAAAVWERRDQFGYMVEALDVDEAIAQAQRSSTRPVYISDSGDNVTAGAPGDSPLLAARLLAAGATDALVAGLVDPAAVRACAAAGVGATVPLRIGATLDPRGGSPLVGHAVVERLEGSPESREAATAVVRLAGVRIILTSERRAFTERSDIAAAGVDPQAQQIVVVKLGYLFPDLAAHAARAILALSSGATALLLESLPYRQLARPIFPLDPQVQWDASSGD